MEGMLIDRVISVCCIRISLVVQWHMIIHNAVIIVTIRTDQGLVSIKLNLLSEMHAHLCLFSFGSIFVIDPHLSQNSDIHHDLQKAADDELRWGFAHIKVRCLENVATCPHQHHLKAEMNVNMYKYIVSIGKSLILSTDLMP